MEQNWIGKRKENTIFYAILFGAAAALQDVHTHLSIFTRQ